MQFATLLATLLCTVHSAIELLQDLCLVSSVKPLKLTTNFGRSLWVVPFLLKVKDAILNHL